MCLLGTPAWLTHTALMVHVSHFSHTLALKSLHSHRCETVPLCRSTRHVNRFSQSVLLNGPQALKHLHTVTHAHPHFLSAFKHDFFPVQLMGNWAAEWKRMPVFLMGTLLFQRSHWGVVGVVHSRPTAGLSPAWDGKNREKNRLHWEDLETSVKQTHKWVRAESSFTSPAAGYGWELDEKRPLAPDTYS